MNFLVRMLEKQKWEKINLVELGYNKTPADTLTGDLKTVSNSLSLWSIETLDKLNDAVLALALMRNQLTRLDVIVIEKDKIVSKDLEILNTHTNGKTPYIGFEKYHYDLINLNYEKLGVFSQIVIDNIADEEKCIRYPKNQVSTLLYEGFKNDKFDIHELDDRLKEDLQKVIARQELKKI